MSDSINPANSNIKTFDDLILPFQVEGDDVSGRFIRCQKSISRILAQHNYPEPVARLLGEALILVSLLGSGMKLKHRLVLQLRGDGALPLIVADYHSDGSLRGYVDIDQELYDRWTGGEVVNPFLLIGKGHLALTVDNGPNQKPYQGIVPIEGESLSAAILSYIEASDQIVSSLKLVLNQKDYDGTMQWYGVAILIQKLGRSGEDFKVEQANSEEQEKWSHAKALFKTISDQELSDPELAPDRLLFNLYHEKGVRIFDQKPVFFNCQCDPERLREVLKNSDKTELEHMADENGAISADCQFCSNKYEFFIKDL